jgi:hypothetical protein
MSCALNESIYEPLKGFRTIWKHFDAEELQLFLGIEEVIDEHFKNTWGNKDISILRIFIRSFCC